MSMQSQSLYEIQVDPQYKEYLNDLCRIVGIQVAANLFFYLSSPSKHVFFSQSFMNSLCFIILGISVYWLIFKKIISFK
jgi:hypothetical protein